MHINPNGFTVYEMFLRTVKRNPGGAAIITPEDAVSYTRLYERVEQLSSWLLDHGGVKGDRVLLWGLNSLQMVEVFLACSKIGLVAVPVNTRLSSEEARYILHDVRPRFFFSDYPLDKAWAKEDADFVEYKISFQGESEKTANYAFILENAPRGGGPKQEVVPDDPFLIIYTAAIGGRPKGAVLSHRNVVTCNVQMIDLFRLGATDVCGIFTPLYHIAGTCLLFCGLHLGIPNVLLPSFEAGLAVEMISAHDVSIFVSFSPMTQRLLEEAEMRAVNLGEHVRAIFGLETPDVIQKYLDMGVDWYGMYAQTEVTGVIAAEKFVRPEQQPGLIGFSGLMSYIVLLNEQGEEVKMGEVGEICVKGETVFSGYWNRPDDTRWAFRHGFLHTGDLAVRDEEGRLWFRGRKTEKELIKSGGENVYPAEVEQVLLEHDAVAYACVIGVAHPVWLEAVKAVVQLKQGHYVSAEELQQFCKGKIASYKIPKIVEIVDEMPLQGNRVDRDRVKKLFGTS